MRSRVSDRPEILIIRRLICIRLALTVKLDQFPDMLRNIEEEGMSACAIAQCPPIRFSPETVAMHFRAACFKGSACFGTDTQIRVWTGGGFFSRPLLWVAPGSTSWSPKEISS